MDEGLRLLVGAFGLFCIGFALAIGIVLLRARRREHAWWPTIGTVLEVRTESRADQRRTRAVAAYEYVDQHQVPHPGEGLIQGFGPGAEGSRIDVLVDPRQPSRSMIKGSSRALNRVLPVLGVLAVVGPVLLWLALVGHRSV